MTFRDAFGMTAFATATAGIAGGKCKRQTDDQHDETVTSSDHWTTDGAEDEQENSS